MIPFRILMHTSYLVSKFENPIEDLRHWFDEEIVFEFVVFSQDCAIVKPDP
jgi:hypothetical protein